MATNNWRLGDTNYMTFPFGIADEDSQEEGSQKGHVHTSKRRAHVRQQIEQVLFTEPGERVFRPEFGAGVWALVFEPNDGAIRQATETRLVDSLAQALAGEVDPRTLAIEVEQDEEKLNITVTYQLAAIQENVSEVFTVGGSNG